MTVIAVKSKCPICGTSSNRRIREDQRHFDASCRRCGWHFTSSAQRRMWAALDSAMAAMLADDDAWHVLAWSEVQR
jgi:ribosomal protein L37AE/L43A